MQESRLFKIVYHLFNKGHATAPELAKKFEVSVRTIYRDIEALSEAGIPVYTETGRSGGVYLMSDFILGKVMLSERKKRINPDIGCQDFSDKLSVRSSILRIYTVNEVAEKLLYL